MFCGSLVGLVLFLRCNKTKDQNGLATFVPNDFVVPVQLLDSAFLLRRIRQSDARLDHEAVMSSAAQLRVQFNDGWPADDFTVTENQEQLAIHEKQFADRVAFVYTILRPDESQVLGCVYIVPDESGECDASLQYWVRTSEVGGELPQRVRKTLEDWLKTHWPFESARIEGTQ